MSLKLKEEHKTFIRVFITYGIHLWLLIFVCNVVILYSIRFFINASTTRTANVKPPIQAISNLPATTDIPSPVPTAVGPVVDLSFSLPGIGTQGGNLQPAHPERSVAVYLYDPDANTSDVNVKPIYTIKTQAAYDNDPNSSTYSFFVNKYVDLGAVSEGRYQIAIQTPQALRNLIRSSDARAIGGQLFELSDGRFSVLPPQTMITGDIYPPPNGDNIMDINDYNMLANCYSTQINSSKCINGAFADLDNNGAVDGIDYNLMLINFRTLASLGLPVPRITITPSAKPLQITPDISVAPEKNAPTGTVQRKTSQSGSFSPIIIFILLIFFAGIIAFVSYKFRLLSILFPKKRDGQSEVQTTPEDQVSDQTVAPTDTKAPATDTIEKSGYLKKVSVDDQTSGTWVTLADDSGTVRGFYPNTNISDGFVNIKGTMKNDEENKPYIFITEIKTEG